MEFTPIKRNVGNYLVGDACDADWVIWTDAAQRHALLKPSGDSIHDLNSLQANRSPATGERILRRCKRQDDYSLVLTAPKSFSVLELSGADCRFGEIAVDAATSCLKLAELLTAPVGVEPDGKAVSQLVACACGGRLNSRDQPHRHVHMVFFQMAFDPTKGKFVTPNLTHLLRAGDLLMTFFQHCLAQRLSVLGYPSVRAGDAWEIKGFPQKFVAQFSMGDYWDDERRPRKKVRSSAFFQNLRGGWRAEIGAPEELAKSLRCSIPWPSDISWCDQRLSVERQLVENDFLVPVTEVVTEILRRDCGVHYVDAANVADEIFSRQSPKSRWFEVDRRMVCSSGDALTEERAFYDVLRRATPAPAGWGKSIQESAWWADALFHDRHRVLVLRERRKKCGRGAKSSPRMIDLERLKAFIGGDARIITPETANDFTGVGPQSIIVDGAEVIPSRKLAHILLAQLRAGGRTILIGARSGWRGMFLEHLSKDASVPTLRPSSGRAMQINGAFTAQKGTAIDVFAQQKNQSNGPLLVCDERWTNEVVEELRARRRAANQKSKSTHLLQLRLANQIASKDRYIQFRRRVGSLTAKWPLKILSVENAGIRVLLAGDLDLFVSAADLHDAEVFDGKMLEVQVGERIRLTRDVWVRKGVRVRAGRRFVVRDVRADGSVVVDGNMVLQTRGHWEYDYCAPVDGPSHPVSALVCGVAELERAVKAGWAEVCKQILVCDKDFGVALEAVKRLSANAADRFPGTENLGVANERERPSPQERSMPVDLS